MRIYHIYFICFFLLSNIIFSQKEQNQLGYKARINSKYLKKDKEILIYLPETYHRSDKKYPVLYVLDGQTYFPLSVGILNMLSQFNVLMVPEFMIVSIINKNSNRDRYKSLVTNQATYSEFIEKELIPFIERKYRSSNERFLFGWQYAGSFSVRLMIDKPALFSAHFAADPYPLMEKFDVRLANDYQTFSKIKSLKNTLYLSVGKNGGTVKEGADFLANAIIVKNYHDFKLEYKILEDEEHRSTPFSNIYMGLKTYYFNYKKLQLNSYKEYQNLGGFQYIKNYYVNRAKRFGFSSEIEPWTMFSLIRSTIRANDYHSFTQLLKDFNHTNLYEKIRLNRGLSFAEFSLKHNKIDEARLIYERLEKVNPESPDIQAGFAKIAKENGNKAKAISFLKKAVSYAKKIKHRSLNVYEKELAGLEDR